jgi:hypothetical protein
MDDPAWPVSPDDDLLTWLRREVRLSPGERYCSSECRVLSDLACAVASYVWPNLVLFQNCKRAAGLFSMAPVGLVKRFPLCSVTGPLLSLAAGRANFSMRTHFP